MIPTIHNGKVTPNWKRSCFYSVFLSTIILKQRTVAVSHGLCWEILAADKKLTANKS